MHLATRILTVLALLALLAAGTSSYAQNPNANPRAFGIGYPESVQDLPPGAFRIHLQSLSPQAQGKALQTLQMFQFTEHDLPYIKVDIEGGVFFADVFLQEADPSTEDLNMPEPQMILESEIFLLHSRPGATNRIYLDFDAHIIG